MSVAAVCDWRSHDRKRRPIDDARPSVAAFRISLSLLACQQSRHNTSSIQKNNCFSKALVECATKSKRHAHTSIKVVSIVLSAHKTHAHTINRQDFETTRRQRTKHATYWNWYEWKNEQTKELFGNKLKTSSSFVWNYRGGFRVCLWVSFTGQFTHNSHGPIRRKRHQTT